MYTIHSVPVYLYNSLSDRTSTVYLSGKKPQPLGNLGLWSRIRGAQLSISPQGTTFQWLLAKRWHPFTVPKTWRLRYWGTCTFLFVINRRWTANLLKTQASSILNTVWRDLSKTPFIADHNPMRQSVNKESFTGISKIALNSTGTGNQPVPGINQKTSSKVYIIQLVLNHYLIAYRTGIKGTAAQDFLASVFSLICSVWASDFEAKIIFRFREVIRIFRWICTVGYCGDSKTFLWGFLNSR
jgi:hypothetical protein